MKFPPETDFWQVGLVPEKIMTAFNPPALVALREKITWLPEPEGWGYVADPFGLQRAGATHVFVEAFDYRTQHGVIEHHEFGPDLVWKSKDLALACPFHLSYPFLVEDGGEVFMIPESHRAREIALYRARHFPGDWVREAVLLPGVPGAEPSLLRHAGRWWMFFTIVGPSKTRELRELHVAYADSLTGPWRQHAQNPVIDDRSRARPGGTPFVAPDGGVILPVQDCGHTYGGAINFLRFSTLTPERISVEPAGSRLTGDLVSDSHGAGFHTLSSCGELTLIDTKRIVRSWARWPVELKRRIGWTPRAEQPKG